MLEKIALISNQNKTWKLLGFADSATCLVVFDGKTDFMPSMPDYIKRKFTDYKSMLERMNLDRNTSCKVCAVVLERYTPKGPDNYDLNDRGKMRNGYTTAVVARAPRDTSTANKMKFFKVQNPKDPTESESPKDHTGSTESDPKNAATASSAVATPPAVHDDPPRPPELQPDGSNTVPVDGGGDVGEHESLLQ